MNMNVLASKVAKLEKGKQELSIAQIKEVLAALATILAKDIRILAYFLSYVAKKVK